MPILFHSFCLFWLHIRVDCSPQTVNDVQKFFVSSKKGTQAGDWEENERNFYYRIKSFCLTRFLPSELEGFLCYTHTLFHILEVFPQRVHAFVWNETTSLSIICSLGAVWVFFCHFELCTFVEKSKRLRVSFIARMENQFRFF